MATRLFTRQTGRLFQRTAHYGLGYGTNDEQAVRGAIESLYGELRTDYFLPGPDGFETGTYYFGGTEFAYNKPWGDPDLSTTSETDAEMLRRIHDHLNA